MALFDRVRRRRAAESVPTGKTPITAAVTLDPFKPVGDQGLLTKTAQIGSETAQQKQLREFDEEGPGFVGSTYDLVARFCSLIDLGLQRRDPETGSWDFLDTRAATRFVENLVGPWHATSGELVYAASRSLDVPGECFIVEVPYEEVPSGYGFAIVMRHNLNRLDSDRFEVTVSREGFMDDDKLIVHRAQILARFYNRHPHWPSEPYAQAFRALDDIQRYKDLTKVVHRSAISRLIHVGLLWFHGTDKDTNKVRLPDGQLVDSQLVQNIRKLTESNQKAMSETHEAYAKAAMPFPWVSTERPEYVDMGPAIDGTVIEALDQALQAFARAVDPPSTMITDGPGTATRWGDLVADEAFKQGTITPRVEATVQAFTEAMLRKRIARGSTWGHVDPREFRLWYRESKVTQKPDNVSEISEAVLAGVLPVEAWSDALGSDTTLDFPEGTSDFDRWLIMSQVNAARRAGSTSGTFGLAELANVDEAMVQGGRPQLPDGEAPTRPGPPLRRITAAADGEPLDAELALWDSDRALGPDDA